MDNELLNEALINNDFLLLEYILDNKYIPKEADYYKILSNIKYIYKSYINTTGLIDGKSIIFKEEHINFYKCIGLLEKYGYYLSIQNEIDFYKKIGTIRKEFMIKIIEYTEIQETVPDLLIYFISVNPIIFENIGDLNKKFSNNTLEIYRLIYKEDYNKLESFLKYKKIELMLSHTIFLCKHASIRFRYIGPLTQYIRLLFINNYRSIDIDQKRIENFIDVIENKANVNYYKTMYNNNFTNNITRLTNLLKKYENTHVNKPVSI